MSKQRQPLKSSASAAAIAVVLSFASRAFTGGFPAGGHLAEGDGSTSKASRSLIAATNPAANEAHILRPAILFLSALVLITALTMLAAIPAHAADQKAPCRLMELTSLPMTPVMDNRFTVPMTVAGKTLNMLLDTGDDESMLSYKTAAAMGLRVEHAQITPFSVLYITPNGLTVTDYTHAEGIQLGNIKGDGNYGYGLVADLPSPNVDGDLGLMFMHDYDIDLDFANRKFNVFSEDHCEGGVVYWTKGPVAVIPIEGQRIAGAYYAKISVQIDGKPIDAWIDTSEPRSVIDWNRAKLMFGLDKNSPGVEAVQASGTGGTLYRYSFKSLTFGNVTINNPKIDMKPSDISGLSKDSPMMYIGADVLHLLHLYIANGEHKLYVTPASAH